MSPEPVAIGATIPEHFRQRLAQHAPLDADPGPPTNVETPQEAEERRLRAQEGVRARWARRLPVMFREATREDLDWSGVRGGWAWPDESANLCLAGPVGTGKTHAAYAIGNDLSRQGIACEAWTVADLLEALRPKDGNDRALRAEAEFWTRRADLLILDDLGATKVSDWAVETLTALMDARLREGLRTIVTTNCTEDDLLNAWGERLMDRLRYRRTVKVLVGGSRRLAEF